MRLVASVSAAIIGAAAFAALAVPPPAGAQTLPSYARPAPRGGCETIHGRVQSVDGPYRITVLDDRGFLDVVALHQGTIINPRGLRLQPGMTVAIRGCGAGSTFDADDIEAPAEYGNPPSYYYDSPGYGVYPDAWWWYPAVESAGSTVIINNPGQNVQPTPSPRRRGIEPPVVNGHPTRTAPDGPYVPSANDGERRLRLLNGGNGDRGGAPMPAYRAPQVEPRPAAPMPAYRAPQVQSRPAPAPPPARSEPARSTSSSTTKH